MAVHLKKKKKGCFCLHLFILLKRKDLKNFSTFMKMIIYYTYMIFNN